MKKIGDLFTQSSGKALKKSNQIGTLHKYITTSNLFWGRFDFSEVREMFFQDSELEKCTARNGDLLVCNGGDVGRAAVWNYDYDICLQNHITRLRKKSDNVNPCYYQHFFRYIKTNNLINGNGVGIESLSSKEILNMSVPYPSIEEQNRIVGIFDRIQSAIDNKKQQLSLLDEAVKSEFVEMFGENPVESGKWSIMKLNSISDVRDGTHDSPTYYSEGYPFITTKNLIDGTIDFSTASLICKKDYEHFDKRSHVDDGDILMPMIGTIGGAILVKKERDFAIKNVALIKPNADNSNLDFNFLLYVLNSDFMFNHFNQFKTGGTQKFISLSFIRELPIPIPPLDLQNKFSAFVQQIDKSKFVVKQQISDLQELLDSKMQEYFT